MKCGADRAGDIFFPCNVCSPEVERRMEGVVKNVEGMTGPRRTRPS